MVDADLRSAVGDRRSKRSSEWIETETERNSIEERFGDISTGESRLGARFAALRPRRIGFVSPHFAANLVRCG
jgi:hypothetical protein